MQTHYIQKILSIVEANLFENYSLEDYVQLTGYSKFHLTRYFKKHVGITLFEYISKRRLAKASNLLLNSEMSLIEISGLLHFQNQESFTRSFKKHYRLPPGKYRKIMKKILKEAHHIMIPKGWFLSGNSIEDYAMTKETKNVHSGMQCAKLSFIGMPNQLQNDEFGTIMQSISAEDYINKRIKFSVFIATKEADKCGLWVRVDDKNETLLKFDNMDNRSITGTTMWNRYSVVMDIPKESHAIHFGVLLLGKGTVWIDNFSIEEVDENTPTTDIEDTVIVLPRQPENLDFELL